MTGGRRRAWLLFACALALRLVVAFSDERRPLLQEHHYADARRHHAVAARMVQDWREGRPGAPTLTPAKRLYDYYLAGLYRVFGARPLAARVLNCLYAAWAIILLFRTAGLLIGPGRAWFFAWFLALWPSHVYFGGQNLRDALILLSMAALLRLSVSAARAGGGAGWRSVATAIGMGLLLLATAFLRPPLLAILAVGATLPLLLQRRGSATAARRLALLTPLAFALLLYPPAARFVFTSLLPPPSELAHQAASEVGVAPADLIGSSAEMGLRQRLARLPSDIERFRLRRQFWDQHHSESRYGRHIETQLFADERFDSFWDVAAFLPKAFFYVAFMPLPGLYPLEGKLGRYAAAFENVLLLALFAAAALRFLRSPRRVEHWLAVSLFAAVALASALFELDLGGATRHKLEYLPFVLMFAFGAPLLADKEPGDGTAS